jgi:TPR repeat protein
LPFSRVVGLARDGNLPAIHHACFSYVYGRNGAPKDEDQAFHYCSLGDAAGADSSTTLLAEILYYGSEKRRDRDRARQLYRKAAKQGHLFATFMVGHLMLENGEDRVEARKWLSLAAARGSPQAIKELDEMDIADRDTRRH